MKHDKQIPTIKTNKEKQKIYQEQMKKYNKAMSNGFYFEALLIVYAILEDRYRAFLYHSAVIASRESIKMDTKKTKSKIREIVSNYGNIEKDKKVIIKLDNISGKALVIQSILKWACTVEDGEVSKDKYLKTLKQQCESIDIGGLLETIDEVSNWCLYRNEVIHGLMNKQLDNLEEHLAEKVEEGKKLARFIDSQVAILKKGNRIRKAVAL